MEMRYLLFVTNKFYLNALHYKIQFMLAGCSRIGEYWNF
jgi:hypothetical protein